MPSLVTLVALLSGISVLPGSTFPAFGALPVPKADASLRIAAFGTSLTSRPGWPDELVPALSRCLGRPVTVDRVALAGSTSDWALSKTSEVVALRPDVVLVEFSANDASLQRFIGVEESRAHMMTVLTELRAGLPAARIYVMGMNPVHGLRGWARPRLDAYVAAHRSAAEAAGVDFIDFTPFWAGLSSEERAASIPDGLHPTPEAATAIMVPELARVLAGPCRPVRAGAAHFAGATTP